MRLRMTAIACFALALFTASPAALAGNNQEQQSSSGHARSAENMMIAADRFDRRSGALRTRSARLRATALELRTEAQELATAGAGDDAPTTTTPGTAPATRMGDQETTTDAEAEPDACGGDWQDEDAAAARQGDGAPAGDGGGSWDDGGDGPGHEVCELLRLADRLEHRADALDAAATRMAGHAAKLREKAAYLLSKAGETDAQRLLAKATRLRAQAAEFRARADRMREEAFTGSDVDEDAVKAVERMELKAASLDVSADRLETRAAKLASSTS